MSDREQYKIMIENDVDFVIDKIIEKNNELTSQGVKIEELETQLQQKENIIKEVREYILKEDEWVKNSDYRLLKTDRLLEILDKETKWKNKIINIIN